MDSRLKKFFDKKTRWQAEQIKLREVLVACGLTEEFKWGKPCYCSEGHNIAIIQPMKEHLALMFFKGTLLDDPAGILEDVGPNSRSGRRILFTSVSQVTKHKTALKALVKDAIAKADREVEKTDELVLVDELRDRLRRDRALRVAFEALTPGRQRGYNLYFSGAKQAKTREDRIEKYAAKILSGKGLRD